MAFCGAVHYNGSLVTDFYFLIVFFTKINIQVVRLVIADEILKPCKLTLKLILQTLSDISQGIYLNLFFLELIFAENFNVVKKKKVLKS